MIWLIFQWIDFIFADDLVESISTFYKTSTVTTTLYKTFPSKTSTENKSITSNYYSETISPAISNKPFVNEKCYVFFESSGNNINSIIEELKKYSIQIKKVFKKRISGFSACANNQEANDKIFEISKFVNLENDGVYKLATIQNYFKRGISPESSNKIYHSEVSSQNYVPVKSQTFYSESSMPYYMFRMRNMGNIFFNNYFLDNLLFEIFGISELIKFFYKYSYYYSGRNVKITSIDSDCNFQSAEIANLVVGYKNSFSKNAELKIVNSVNCDGTIKLSDLLDTMDKIDIPDILLLPLSGPSSEILDIMVDQISKKSIVVAASGNNDDNSCNYSPNGRNIIKVGSVNKHGNISEFSNKGACNRIYAIGETSFQADGTSYSASIVASAVAIYLEKHPGARIEEIMKFLLNNSMKAYSVYPILQIPELLPGAEVKRRFTFFSGYDSLYFVIFLIILAAIIVFLSKPVYRYYKYRREKEREIFVLDS